MGKDNSDYRELQEKIFIDRKSGWTNQYQGQQEEIFEFAEKYKQFLAQSKTERLCVKNIVKILEKNEFEDIDKKNEINQGDKLYQIFRNKSILAVRVGEKPDQLRIVGSHVDSPRLDLKPNPVYEDSELALFKGHYYGGLKKYHLMNTPLAIHGVVMTESNGKIEISLGEGEDDPGFIIPDLLIHLSKDRMKKSAKKVVKGEELNILVGHIPIDEENIEEKVKFALLKYLHQEYGIIEEDFNSAELKFVPAEQPRDIGFDRGLISGYGQDDRISVYTSLKAICNSGNTKETAIAFFTDKEETGSHGDTGAKSFLLRNFIRNYISKIGQELEYEELLEDALSISADVTSGLNPNFKEVHEKENAIHLGRGVSIQKYGGSGGKYSTHDAHAEYMAYMRRIANENNIPWQTGELGKIDKGGGGSIGMFLSRYGMNCIDIGPAVLGMHSPSEISSKLDLFAAYKFYKAFYEDNKYPKF